MNRFQKRSLTVQKGWDELAQSSPLGFANEKEMLESLTKECSDKAIADLLGFATSTIQRRRGRYGIISCLWQSMFEKLKWKEVMKHVGS